MRRRSSIRVRHGLVVTLLVLPSCASSSSTGPSSDPETTGATTVIDACSLITEDDAGIALGAEIEIVEDPIGEGLVVEEPGEIASACGFRPSGTDDGRAIVISIAAPGSVTPELFDRLTEGAIALGGPGDEGYATDNGVLFRSGDLVVGVVVRTGEGMDTDRALALELAAIAAAGLPPLEGP